MKTRSYHYTKKQVVAMFKESVMPGVRAVHEQDGRMDRPARREAWNNMVDSLAKNDDISWHQANTWTHPAICGG